MDANGPHYRIHGYFSEHSFFEWTEPVNGPRDNDLIELTRKQITPEPEQTLQALSWADLFYCYGREVRLIGTWVITPVSGEEPAFTWHAGGWADRAKPSREKALRFLHELGRSA